MKDKIASRYFASGTGGHRAAAPGTEPVHAIVADSEAEVRGQFAARQLEEDFRQGADPLRPPPVEERRKNDRRKRQVHILLDTRITPSRRSRLSIDEKV